jgi:hypothetical protein
MLKLFAISSLLLATPAAAEVPLSSDLLPLCRASIVAAAKGDENYLERETKKKYSNVIDQYIAINGCVMYSQGLLDGLKIGTEGKTHAVSYLRHSN